MLIRRQGLRRTVDDVELATLQWVHWSTITTATETSDCTPRISSPRHRHRNPRTTRGHPHTSIRSEPVTLRQPTPTTLSPNRGLDQQPRTKPIYRTNMVHSLKPLDIFRHAARDTVPWASIASVSFRGR